MTTVSQEAREAEVTEADKDAAAELAHAIRMSCEDFTSWGADVLVQAFARHRQQAERGEVVACRYPVHGSVTHVRNIECCDFCGYPADTLPTPPEAGQ